MKTTLFFTLCLLAASHSEVHAQRLSYGAHAGINISGYQDGDVYRVYDAKAKTGYTVGADVAYRLGARFLLLSGANFSQLGGRFATMSPYVDNTGHQATEFKEVNTRVLTFEIPLKIGYDIMLSRNCSIIPNVGLFGRYTIASIRSNIVMADDEMQKWKATDDYNRGSQHLEAFKRLDYGVVGGIDLLFANHFTLSADYKQGLKTIQPQFGMKSWTADFSVGYRW